MLPINFEGSNMEFTKPEGWTDEECGSLSAYRGEDANGRVYINTLWMPSKEDIEAIVNGRGIVLTVTYPVMIPVMLWTIDADGKPNE